MAALTDAPISTGESLKLTHVLEPGAGDQRQNVVVRVTLTPAPNVGTSLAVYTSICAHVASAQLVDTATGAPQLVLNLSLGWDP